MVIEERIEEFENKNGALMVRITIIEIDESGNETVVGVIEKGKPSDEPKPVPGPEEAELLQAEILLNQAAILARQNEQDEVLAEILLNQMGV